MAVTELMILFVCFAMVFWRWQRRRCSRILRRRISAMGRHLQAFYDQQDKNLPKILAAIISDGIMRSAVQRRVLWVRNRNQSFTEITASWDNLEWKRNFRINRITFQHLCTELRGKLEHSSTVRSAVSVEKRVAITLWRLGTNVEYHISSEWEFQQHVSSFMRYARQLLMCF